MEMGEGLPSAGSCCFGEPWPTREDSRIIDLSCQFLQDEWR